MSVYGIIYAGGFGVTNSPENVKWLLEQNSEIELQVFDDSWMAYNWCCEGYTRRFLNQHPNMQHKLPSLDEVLKMPYHKPNFVKNVPQNRFFATMKAGYIAIYDNVDDLMDFMLEFDGASIVKEFDSYDKACQYIINEIWMYIMPKSAYLHGEIPNIMCIHLNIAMSIQRLAEWFQQNCQLPKPWSTQKTYHRQIYMPFEQEQIGVPQTKRPPLLLPQHPMSFKIR